MLRLEVHFNIYYSKGMIMKGMIGIRNGVTRV